MDEEKPAAFKAKWRGERPTVSAGGTVFSFVVDFGEDSDKALKALGGTWSPDKNIFVAIATNRGDAEVK